MLFGVDYYPEHWPESKMEEDLKRIVELGANTVRIGEFAWHMMEPVEGKYDFSFFDRAIERIKSHGLQIIFGTPTATFPAWLASKYPEILSRDEYGHQKSFGGRRQYCYNSDVYKDKTEKIVSTIMDHYSNEEAIIAYQIDNELGHEGSDQCYCEICVRDFRRYLSTKYETIEQLNMRYGTIFWGQTYNDFDEVPAPLPTITTHNPSLQLDWARFRSESINTYAKLQIDIVRTHKLPHQKITHNLFGGFFDRAYDQNVLASHLDVVSYDNYPVWGGLEKPLSPAHIAMTHDYIRGLKKQNFWIVEELMGAQGHTVIGYLPRPGEAKLWSHQAMARGCESLLYFRWRGMTKGAEQFCQGILDADDQINDKYTEAQTFFSDVKDLESVYTSEIHPDVAILYDYDNRWSWHNQPQSHAFNYTDEILRFYTPYHDLNIMTDVIDLKKSFQQYKVLMVPMMQIMDQETIDRLRTFASNGGTVVLGFRSGIKDRDNNLYFGESPLKSLIGAEIKSYESLGHGVVKPLISYWNTNHTQKTCGVWRDLIEPIDAKPLLKYDDEFYGNYAAVVSNKVGLGKVYYVGCGLSENGMHEIVNEIIADQSIRPNLTPEGVESVIRKSDRNTFEILLNHNGTSVEHNGLKLKPYDIVIKKR